MFGQMVNASGNPSQIVYRGQSAGPMVVEIPAAGNDGLRHVNVVTLWQTALEDAGLLGVDLQPIDGSDVMTLRSTRISIRRGFSKGCLAFASGRSSKHK
jgi:hypothetical protein